MGGNTVLFEFTASGSYDSKSTAEKLSAPPLARLLPLKITYPKLPKLIQTDLSHSMQHDPIDLSTIPKIKAFLEVWYDCGDLALPGNLARQLPDAPPPLKQAWTELGLLLLAIEGTPPWHHGPLATQNRLLPPLNVVSKTGISIFAVENQQVWEWGYEAATPVLDPTVLQRIPSARAKNAWTELEVTLTSFLTNFILDETIFFANIDRIPLAELRVEEIYESCIVPIATHPLEMESGTAEIQQRLKASLDGQYMLWDLGSVEESFIARASRARELVAPLLKSARNTQEI